MPKLIFMRARFELKKLQKNTIRQLKAYINHLARPLGYINAVMAYMLLKIIFLINMYSSNTEYSKFTEYTIENWQYSINTIMQFIIFCVILSIFNHSVFIKK
jgi:hypothetical protein